MTFRSSTVRSRTWRSIGSTDSRRGFGGCIRSRAGTVGSGVVRPEVCRGSRRLSLSLGATPQRGNPAASLFQPLDGHGPEEDAGPAGLLGVGVVEDGPQRLVVQ